MSDDLHKQDESHWRRLAEELGLPVDEFAPIGAREAPAPPPEPPVRDAGEPDVREADAVEPVPPTEIGEPWRGEDDLHRAEVMDASEFGGASAEAPGMPPPGRQRGEDEGDNRRGRGRRRRGRGRGDRRGDERRGDETQPPREASAEGAPEGERADRGAASSGAASEGADEPHGDHKRRGRRRRRRSDAAPAHARPADDAPMDADEETRPEGGLADEEMAGEEAEYVRPAAAVEDDEPEEDFSDWNVPSWNDLIASLYRPDR